MNTNFDARQWPEVKRLMDDGVHLKQHHFRLDGSEMAAIFNGASPANDGSTVETTEEPVEGFAIRDLPERPEEFAPGLTPELQELVEAAAQMAERGSTTVAARSAVQEKRTVSRSRRAR